jgi:RNA polymerase sigma-70 factor (ECF subfamily)
MSDTERVTRLLRDWAGGDQAAREQVVPLVYDTLKRLASKYLSSERNAGTLQPTALVHEAYMRLVDQKLPDWQNRNHFYGVAAHLMRQILVDHARSRLSAKRGGGAIEVELDRALGVGAGGTDENVLALGSALDQLQEMDERRCRIIELRYFGGFTEEETGKSLDISPATVRRETRLAEAWLYTRMHPAESGGRAQPA